MLNRPRPLPRRALVALGAALAIAVPASAAQAAHPQLASCPTFRVLHNDPLAGYSAGVYDMQVWGGVSCASAVDIFRAYLSRPASLPRGWFKSVTGPAFVRGRTGRTGFSLRRAGRRTTPHGNGAVTNCPRRLRLRATLRQSGYDPGTYRLQVFGTVACAPAAFMLRTWVFDPVIADLPAGWFPFADAPGFYYNRGPGGGFYAFKA
jgi:hypothetical protein